MKILLFISVLVVIVCIGMLIAVISANSRKTDREDGNDSRRPDKNAFGR